MNHVSKITALTILNNPTSKIIVVSDKIGEEICSDIAYLIGPFFPKEPTIHWGRCEVLGESFSATCFTMDAASGNNFRGWRPDFVVFDGGEDDMSRALWDNLGPLLAFSPNALIFVDTNNKNE